MFSQLMQQSASTAPHHSQSTVELLSGISTRVAPPSWLWGGKVVWSQEQSLPQLRRAWLCDGEADWYCFRDQELWHSGGQDDCSWSRLEHQQSPALAHWLQVEITIENDYAHENDDVLKQTNNKYINK